jgi:predicted DCC family thiol-disulfide oxidoreductase YuxK
MKRLYVLYDERCGLCRWARQWVLEQPAIVPLEFVAAGSERALRMFPGVAKPGEPEELIVVGDEGQVYRGDSAWIMCLYALEDYREWSLRLASPLLRPLARKAFAMVTKRRGVIGLWLGLSDQEAAEALRHVEVAPCEFAPKASGLKAISEMVHDQEPISQAKGLL